MNLFYDPSLKDLSLLLENCNELNCNLVVDHDGEVLLASNSEGSKKLLRRYRFYVRGLGQSVYNNLSQLNQLYKNLVYCWEKKLVGKVNNEKISRVEKLSHWMEISNFSEESGKHIIAVLFSRKKSIPAH